ncbi:GNAT family N-acetyltransferase [Tianweitania sp. BSSL-BM11]|uniref:GNAT family N-acetyltransferase n=1 Tax=Tianweitania aestuarii TaxID=2814886 RepID=A0ABS5RUN7_9HYPH|nr:GNAT family N-acetyltransferase [Tianweitania aestuarii]MBS9720724.1 GNAT family N-acetyltransferase [Tianweitania aestuarii]
MITTDRLLLRPHTIEDMDAHHAMHAEPEVYRFLGGRPATREETWLRLLRFVGHWTSFGYGLFAVIDRATGKLIGDTGLAYFCRELGPEFDAYPETAWIFSASVHGQGKAFEAASAAHAWFEAKTGKREAVAIINPENAPSLRLADKLGYQAFGSAIYKEHNVTMLRRAPTP